MGVWRGVLAAGEAICFGLDSAKISYRAFASGIFTFYFVGIIVLYYLTASQVTESCYFKEGEEGAIVPNYVKENSGCSKTAESRNSCPSPPRA